MQVSLQIPGVIARAEACRGLRASLWVNCRDLAWHQLFGNKGVNMLPCNRPDAEGGMNDVLGRSVVGALSLIHI